MSAGRAAVRRRQVRTGFTLAELVMSIAVLALAGVFLAQVFLSADRMATKASDLDHAVSLCTTVAEEWKAGAVSPGDLAEFAGGQTVANAHGGYDGSGWLDAGMKPCAPADARFTYAVHVVWDVDLYRFTVTVSYKGDAKALYSLEAARWAPAPAVS